ncbi:protein catecholamines up-like [Tripterygium wilfordii]|uniref:Protein catecholamines up-like n=1 Tax=Tripterygium wilfordii TaxID=458696 RepID=A0A7J7CCB9_TRIWF|nr:protein catecholamines up-like [Tripterygium wilfordii]
MGRCEMFTLMFLAAISVFLPKMESQVAPRPLCSSQLALVNYACSMLPSPYAPPLSSSLNSSLDEHDNGKRNISGHENRHHDRDDEDDDNDHDHDNHHHRHHCHHRHCHHDHDHEHDQDHHHHHHHHHHHDDDDDDDHHHHHENPVEANCCHWLTELADECVCDMLVHLPVFLARPAHQYTIMVDDSCNVTYTCGGRVRP